MEVGDRDNYGSTPPTNPYMHDWVAANETWQSADGEELLLSAGVCVECGAYGQGGAEADSAVGSRVCVAGLSDRGGRRTELSTAGDVVQCSIVMGYMRALECRARVARDRVC